MEREGGSQGGPRASSPLVRIGLGEGGRRPPFLLPPHFLGVGLLLGAPIGPAGLLPLLLYIRGQGAPLDTQVDPRDRILTRVRCPLPP